MDTETIQRQEVTTPLPQIDNFAVIIGAMKCGTSSLFAYLKQHPQMCRGVRKELNFFSSDKRWRQGRDAYLALWPTFDPAVHRYALDASPEYTKMPMVKGIPERIAGFGGNFRYIYIVRNPVDRIESHLAHNIGMGRLPFRVDFGHWRVRHAVRTSRYAYQLDAFRAGLGNPDVLLLDFDEFRRAPLAVAERCVRFLGLEPGFEFREIPPSNTRNAVRPRIARAAEKARRAAEFRLDADRRAIFARRLRADIIEFRDRYGFDVSGWNLL